MTQWLQVLCWKGELTVLASSTRDRHVVQLTMLLHAGDLAQVSCPKLFWGGGLLQADMFAHNKSGIAYQDKN
jgi:hypothetical protein